MRFGCGLELGTGAWAWPEGRHPLRGGEGALLQIRIQAASGPGNMARQVKPVKALYAISSTRQQLDAGEIRKGVGEGWDHGPDDKCHKQQKTVTVA